MASETTTRNASSPSQPASRLADGAGGPVRGHLPAGDAGEHAGPTFAGENLDDGFHLATGDLRPDGGAIRGRDSTRPGSQSRRRSVLDDAIAETDADALAGDDDRDGLPHMTAAPAHPVARQRSAAAVRERIVLLSIALVATAMTSMLHIQMGYQLLVAMGSSALFMVLAILAHQLFLRVAEVRRLRRELERRSARHGADDFSAFDMQAPAAADPTAATRNADQIVDGVAAGLADEDGAHRRAGGAGREAGAPMSDADRSGQGKSTDSGQSADRFESISERWTLHPRDPDASESNDRDPVEPIESDLARVQRKIRELALEVNGGTPSDAALDATASQDAPAPEDADTVPLAFGKRNAPPVAASTDNGATDASLDRAPHESDGAKNAAGKTSQLDASINALKNAASTMRTHGLPSSSAATEPSRTAASTPPGMPSFSDPFHIPSGVQRIAASTPATKSPVPTRSPETDLQRDMRANAQRDLPTGLPDLKIPATAVPVRSTSGAPQTKPQGQGLSAPVRTAAVTVPPAAQADIPAPPPSRQGVPADARQGPYTEAAPDPFDFADVIAAALPAPVNPRLEAIAKAIDASRMEITLSPIVGLETHAVSHYAIAVHLIGENGETLDDANKDLTLEAGDLLALFDEARLRRAASLAGQLAARKKSGALMSSAGGSSVSRQPFADAATEIGGDAPSIASRLIVNFTQRDVQRFSRQDWQSLAEMQAFGFRFAVSDVERLDVDFETLAARGFVFVCATAKQLIEGFGPSGAKRPASAACQIMASAGLTVVATEITDPVERAKVFGFGALFGQGMLFGAPRKVPVEPWQPNGSNGRTAAA